MPNTRIGRRTTAKTHTVRGLFFVALHSIQVTSDYGGAINEKSLSAPGVIEIKLSSQLSELTQAQLRVEAANLVQEGEFSFREVGENEA